MRPLYRLSSSHLYHNKYNINNAHRQYGTGSVFASDQSKFYKSYNIAPFLQHTPDVLTLNRLSLYSRHLTLNKIIGSANYVRKELCIRLAHRLRDFHQTLPFIVGRNPRINLVYGLYFEAFEQLSTGFDQILSVDARPQCLESHDQNLGVNKALFKYNIKTLDDNVQFCDLLQRLLKMHEVAIPNLAAGIIECGASFRALSLQDDPQKSKNTLQQGPFIQVSQMDRFVNDLLKTRIGRRVLAEQHIIRSKDYLRELSGEELSESDGFGIVQPDISAVDVVKQCSQLAIESLQQKLEDSAHQSFHKIPEVRIDGDLDTKFMYITDHIEYILFELIKNALWATLFNKKQQSDYIYVTICPEIEQDHQRKQREALQQHQRYTEYNPSVSSAPSTRQVIFRISDHGGGFEQKVLPNESITTSLWSFCHHNQLLKHFDESQVQSITKKRLNMPQDTKLLGKLSDSHTFQSPSADQAGHSASSKSPLKIGLQLARAFAQYWGGDIRVESMRQYGSDVYVTIDTSGDVSEQLTE
ncbi:hypothetical protein MIR68_008321 [Amoeboaphelidium protococcarum]|nr:hypothetical protein MIR68_008321 [Amoeboaphelidium protococcarum]